MLATSSETESVPLLRSSPTTFGGKTAESPALKVNYVPAANSSVSSGKGVPGPPPAGS